MRYRAAKLDAINSNLRPLINPLLKAVGQRAIEPLGILDIQELTLHDLTVELDLHNRQWHKKAEEALVGTDIGITRWREIASDLLLGRQPDLSVEEQKALVKKDILKVQVTFGGST